ncbi:hypothetical protein IEO70_13230 [Bacillus sp. AGMB 02131]|uniref:Uncharacterized protein n=1 Tax=Peribacillus faecalis TaxID=2772559 RepID=A0A927CX16_9BACI|nr:hypothetical protein [Peribacillus faecalis]MBD3109308.1 hypothetical protein [Peribacillus faecalis]
MSIITKIRLTMIGAFSVLFAGLLTLLQNKWNLTLLLFQLSSKEISSIALIISAICFSALLFSYFSKLKKSKILYALVLMVSGFLLVVFILGCLLNGFITESKYYAFQSPDQQQTLVIEEESFLLAGYGSFYMKEYPLFVKRVQDYSTDDGYRPFQLDDAHIKWHEDNVTIEYGNGLGDRDKAIVHFE